MSHHGLRYHDLTKLKNLLVYVLFLLARARVSRLFRCEVVHDINKKNHDIGYKHALPHDTVCVPTVHARRQVPILANS